MEINVERTGFPIKISGFEFFFDASIEGIERYAKNYQEALNYLNSLEEIGDGLEDRKNILRKSYDAILGEGTFDKLYNKIPDVVALSNTFFAVVDGIDEEVAKVVRDQDKKSKNIIDMYTKKKTTKK